MCAAAMTTSTREKMFELPKRWTDEIQSITAITPPVAVAHDATLWLFGVDEFRKKERKAIEEGQYEATLELHRMALTQIIANGERILFFAKSFGLPEGFTEFTPKDLEATLESVYITLRRQHGPKNHPERNKDIASLFDAT